MPGTNTIISVKGIYEGMDLDLRVGFEKILQKRIAADPILQLASKSGTLQNGVIVYPKFGADEDIVDISAVIEDDYSNKQSYIKINFNQGYKTKPILLSKTVYQQLGYSGIEEAQLNIKADKLVKFKIEKLIYNLLHPEMGFSDGAAQTKDVLNTDINTGEKIYDLLAQEIMNYRRKGVKDSTGKNIIDSFRTGLSTSDIRIAMSPEFALLFRKFYATLNQSSSQLENGSIGNVLGVDVYESIYLPFNDRSFAKGAGTLTTPSKFGNKDKIIQTEGNKNYQFMIYTNGSFDSKTAINSVYNTEMRQSTNREIGWEMIDGAGTLWADEITMFNVTTATPPAAE